MFNGKNTQTKMEANLDEKIESLTQRVDFLAQKIEYLSELLDGVYKRDFLLFDEDEGQVGTDEESIPMLTSEQAEQILDLLWKSEKYGINADGTAKDK